MKLAFAAAIDVVLMGLVLACNKADKTHAPVPSATPPPPTPDVATARPTEMPEARAAVQTAYEIATTKTDGNVQDERGRMVTDRTNLYWADQTGVHAVALSADPGAVPRTISTRRVRALGAGHDVLFAVTADSTPPPGGMDPHAHNAIIQLVPAGKPSPVFRTKDRTLIEDLGVTSTTLVWRETRYTELSGFECGLGALPLSGGTPSPGRYHRCGGPSPIVATGMDAFTVEREAMLEWQSATLVRWQSATRTWQWPWAGGKGPVEFEALASLGSTLFAQGCLKPLESKGPGPSVCPEGMRGLFRYEGDAVVRAEPIGGTCTGCLAVDDDYVYWIDPTDRTLRRRRIEDSGRGVALSELGDNNFSHLLVTERTVYWLEERGAWTADRSVLGTIRAIPKPE